MTGTLTHLIAVYGYVIVGVAILVESFGIPLPGETTLLIAAGAAGAGHLAIIPVFLVAAGAAVVGDAGGYWLGRSGGRALIARYGGLVRLNAERMARIEAFFGRHGPRAVFFGRFIGLLRSYTALFAGITRMPYATFSLFNVIAGVLWALIFSGLGYFFGQNLDVIGRIVGLFGWALLGCVLLIIVAVLLWRWIASHRDALIEQRDWLLANPLVARLRIRYRRQIAWVRRRLSPSQYLGLHLTLGLLAAMGGLWLFGGLVEDVFTNDPLVVVDQMVANGLHRLATPAATTLFLVVTDFGSLVLVALGVVVAALWAWRRRWLELGAWCVALGGGEALNLVLKQVFARPRPVFAQPLLVARDFSFPSGHAMMSLIGYGMLAYFAVLLTRSWRLRTAAIGGATLLVLLIGFSRLYLGVHYLSDVIAGYAAGMVWLSTCITGMELARRGELSEAWKQRF
jgi:undecaprenyl-diphosphatase